MENKTCGECRYYVSELKRCNMRKIICNIQPTDTGCSCFERKPNFKEGNFSDTNIPNFLRKIRNAYRKDPVKCWEELEKKENES